MIGRPRHWIAATVFFTLAGVVAICAIFWSGFAERWLRGEIISQIEQKTGARVEIGGFHFELWHLQAEIDNLTLHGLEAATSPPLFHADCVDVAIRVISFFGREVVLDRLAVERPQVSVRIGKDGRSNIPTPDVKSASGSWRETLFRLRIATLALDNGTAAYNDQRVPLDVHGNNFQFDLHYDASAAGADSYAGIFSWQQVELAAWRDRPFRFDLSAKFTLHRDAFELDELICKLPHSDVNLRAELPNFARPEWNFRYRGTLSLEDVRTIFRAPLTPQGLADFSGNAHYVSSGSPSNQVAGKSGGQWTGGGYYRARELTLPYQWFHESGIETSGDYSIADRKLTVPNLQIRALNGDIAGTLEMDLPTLAFRTETHLREAQLAAALAAVDNVDMPVQPLHWDSTLDLDSTNTWQGAFKHFRSKGEMRWTPSAGVAQSMIPAAARVEYDYSQDQRSVAVTHSEITTPDSRLEMDGFLGARDSALEVNFQAGNLQEWDDFINAILGSVTTPKLVSGKVAWQGRILGPLAGPAFVGRLRATDARYDKLYWEELDGDIEYSPDLFRLSNAIARHGNTTANMNVELTLDGDWSFLPSSPWKLDARLNHSDSADLQSVLGTAYPMTGFITGAFHGSGTRADPKMDGNFVAENIGVKNYLFDRLSGILHVEHDEIGLSSAELRMGPGRVTGNVTYHPAAQQAEFDLTGSGVELGKINQLQTPSLSIAGQMIFHLKGSGPVRAPTGKGDFQIASLKIGSEVEGGIAGDLNSDGRNARLSFSTSLAHGKMEGQMTVGLAGDRPVSGELTAEQVDLDPFIVAGLHLKQLTGHSSVDGTFEISGSLDQPDSIGIEANISRISFDYEFVQLTNEQNIQIDYHRNEVRVDQARLHGTDTDVQFAGTARFDRDRPLHLTLSGGMNLRLLEGILPELEAQGHADVNVSIAGTMSQPRITGRASVRNASGNFADFPAGLSNVNGDFVFDSSRLLFERVVAETGGGQLTLGGNVSYGGDGLRYEINASTPSVRVRYPAGMSWLAGGTLHLSGSSNAALLTGNVQVQRLLFAQGMDVTSLFASASETSTGPGSASAFLANLSFDVQAQTNSGARIEWGGAQIEIDGDVRLRGTADRPVLLGNVHLLGGEMTFRGNTYELTRGDINFSNPFRLDPVIDVEATSTISQYQVTIDFSGPASRLALNYRSDPPLPSSDIIALLALGRTGEETGPLSQSTSQNYGATALLSEAISTGLGGRIEHLFGISQFRVDPFVAGTATESNAAARITIEQRVAQNLTITYSSNAATSNQYQLIQVEYTLKRGLSLVFLRDINDAYSFDIEFVKHLH